MQTIFQSKINENIIRITSGIEDLSQTSSYIVPKENTETSEIKKATGEVLEVEGIGIEIDLKNKTVSFKVDAQTNFYGLGQHQKGVINYKGQVVTIKHHNTTIAIPFLITNKGYGILWDNNGTVTADFTEDDKATFTNKACDYIDFYIICGETIDQIIQNYWSLTGKAPMIPKSAFGFWQSKMRYTSQDELLKVAEAYREKNYPMDIIVVDFYHWTQMGDFEFDPEFWPNPKEMYSKLKEFNVDCMVSVWPYISAKSKNFMPMAENKMFACNNKGETIEFTIFNGEKSGLYDPFNEKAREYIWEKAKTYYEEGAKIWWLDSCEPDDGLNVKDFIDGGINSVDGPMEDRINAYALMHCKTFYDGQRKDFNNERVLILARSAFAGCQRYGVTVWSGDVGYDFTALRKQITAGLGATMSGLPFWTTDIGGFKGGNPKDEEYRELYIRWFEYGAFCPFFRVHGSRGAICRDDLIFGISRGENELWSFGEELERIMVKYDNLRYKLIPYIYSSARMTIVTGTPLMRALVIDFEEDKRAVEITDQFMFGKAMMVCPVIEKGAKERMVYLPEGSKWYDFWTNEIYDGGQTIKVNAELDTIPVFVKAGSIIPTDNNIVGYTHQSNDIELNIYPGADNSFTYYDDDGKTYNYEKGDYTEIVINWVDKDKRIELLNIPDNCTINFTTKII